MADDILDFRWHTDGEEIFNVLEDPDTPVLDIRSVDGGTEEGEEGDGYEINDSKVDGDDVEEYRSETLRLLESMALDVVQQLASALPTTEDPKGKCCPNKKITIRLADRRKPAKEDGSYGMRSIVFPQKTKYASARSLAQITRVIDLVHEAVTNRVPTTKRDIYYKDVKLFKSQAVADKLVDDIAATIGMRRADLYVRASSKGLFCGAGLAIYMQSGDIVCGTAAESTLIPPGEEIARFEVNEDVCWVLIVEKEAVFHTLCHMMFTTHPDLTGQGIIITGKGYPDVATRQLVCTLSNNLPATVPILALVDADPYGIDILSVYKHGSASMVHEVDALAAPRVRWAGVMASELARLGVDTDELLPITQHDEKKAMAMLRKGDLPRKWKKELQYMLYIRRKAEIEVLSCTPAPTQVPAYITVGTDQPGDDDEGVPGSGGSALVQYLVKKVERAVQDCERKYGYTS